MFWQLVKRFNMFEMEVEKKERKKIFATEKKQ